MIYLVSFCLNVFAADLLPTYYIEVKTYSNGHLVESRGAKITPDEPARFSGRSTDNVDSAKQIEVTTTELGPTRSGEQLAMDVVVSRKGSNAQAQELQRFAVKAIAGEKASYYTTDPDTMKPLKYEITAKLKSDPTKRLQTRN